MASSRNVSRIGGKSELESQVLGLTIDTKKIFAVENSFWAQYIIEYSWDSLILSV